jgi:hypothetical protein
MRKQNRCRLMTSVYKHSSLNTGQSLLHWTIAVIFRVGGEVANLGLIFGGGSQTLPIVTHAESGQRRENQA